ncbi:MAG: BlaI/MecI/CopY family transcriptional regulator [Planctomycetota bacterium]
MPSNIPNISEAEWTIMEVVWSRSPLTANQVIQALDGHCDWHPKTIRTMLNRLVHKQALRYEQSGREYLYRPAVTRDRCVKHASRSFLKQVFGGASSSLLAHFVQHEKLTDEDVDRLRQLLDQRKDA